MVTIKIALHANPRESCFWRLNTSYLSETQDIEATIQGVKKEYQNDKSINVSLLWQMVKLKVTEQTLRYAKTKKAKMLREEEVLEKTINKVQRQTDSACNNANKQLAIDIQFEKKTRKLAKIFEYRTKAAILRAKRRWYN